MFKEAQSDSSAFKPYAKSSDKNVCLDKSLNGTTSKVSKNSQTQPFDYTVENLLNKPSSKVTTQSHLVNSTTAEQLKPNAIPFDLITHQLLWQTQRQLAQDKLQTFQHENNFDIQLLGAPQLRRFFETHNSASTRQNRGPRRQRTTFTHEQTLRLEMEYHVSEYISRGKRFQLAELLDLTENQIKIWFQNRRAKDKRIEKAIVEQQYRYLSVSSSSLPQQLNLTNCTTCNYTKHQFENNSSTVTTTADDVNVD